MRYTMATPMFRFAKREDRVWDLRYGWGRIIHIKTAAPHGSYQFFASFDTARGIMERTFSIEGIDLECENQTAFTTELKLAR